MYWLGTSLIFTYQDYYLFGHDPILFFSHLTNVTMMGCILYQLTSCVLTFVAATESCTGKRRHRYVLYQPVVLKPTVLRKVRSSNSRSRKSRSIHSVEGSNNSVSVDGSDDGYYGGVGGGGGVGGHYYGGDEEAIPLIVQQKSLQNASMHSTSLSTIYSTSQRYDTMARTLSPTTTTTTTVNTTSPQSQAMNNNNNKKSNNNNDNTINPSTRPTLLVCLNWFLYMIVQPAEITVAIGYWLYEFHPGKDTIGYNNLYKHGIIAILLLIDGNIIGRIPLRIKHIYAVFIYMNMYGLYTIYFSYSDFGSRHHHGFIYDNFNWKYDRDSCIHMTLMLGYIITPLSFVFCYLLSLLSFGSMKDGITGKDSMSSHGIGGGYCCWYHCFTCIGDLCCGFRFDASRRILYDHDERDGDVVSSTRSSNHGQPKVILSQPWKSERKRYGGIGKKQSTRRGVSTSTAKDKMTQSVASSIASTTQYQQSYVPP